MPHEFPPNGRKQSSAIISGPQPQWQTSTQVDLFLHQTEREPCQTYWVVPAAPSKGDQVGTLLTRVSQKHSLSLQAIDSFSSTRDSQVAQQQQQDHATTRGPNGSTLCLVSQRHPPPTSTQRPQVVGSICLRSALCLVNQSPFSPLETQQGASCHRLLWQRSVLWVRGSLPPPGDARRPDTGGRDFPTTSSWQGSNLCLHNHNLEKHEALSAPTSNPSRYQQEPQ